MKLACYGNQMTFKFPPSYKNALKRLTTIEKKMEKDPTFCQKYTGKINDYIEKGVCTKIHIRRG